MTVKHKLDVSAILMSDVVSTPVKAAKLILIQDRKAQSHSHLSEFKGRASRQEPSSKFLRDAAT